MPEELWMEVHDIVQEAVIKTIPQKKTCKKAKWLSEESLQIAEKRTDVKGKGEKTTLLSGRVYFLVRCFSPNLFLKLKKVRKTTKPFR